MFNPDGHQVTADENQKELLLHTRYHSNIFKSWQRLLGTYKESGGKIKYRMEMGHENFLSRQNHISHVNK